jgi:hypothetical protein
MINSFALNSPALTQTQLHPNGDLSLKSYGIKIEDWESRWERNIIGTNWRDYCENELGEEIGWLISPFLRGFYYGYLATNNPKYIDMLMDCTDLWIKRARKEPDGYPGWPKIGAAGTDIDDLDDFYADSMLGEAMGLTPLLLLANEIAKRPSLKEKYGLRAEEYVKLSEQIFQKWDSRGGWREVDGGGVVTVELPFGIEKGTGNWTGEYEARDAPGRGFSHPDNKANLVAIWLIAMFDATGRPAYAERAERWFRVMKSRMKLRNDNTYEIWSYWEPAGVWDYKSNGLPKHWIGVHPKAGYYDIDVAGIATAYEHRMVFNKDDITHLSATALANKRYWAALVPYDGTIQKNFEYTQSPSSWDGIHRAPWYLAIIRRLGGSESWKIVWPDY